MCSYCPHVFHGTAKCGVLTCRCKGKKKWWQTALASLGNAIGESLFGGNR
jgi:hypothetical protein